MSFPLLSRRVALLTASWMRDPLWRRARMMPSMSLQFAKTRSLIDVVSGQNLITFSRLSDATTINSAGQIQVVAAGVPRFTHDPVTLECLGLLREEQRVQILELTDALSTQTKTVTAVAHTLSFYGTGTVALSGAHTATVVGTGAYPARTILTFTPASGALTLTVTGTVQFGQLEIGGPATSYIPNSGISQVVRADDVAVMTGANFSRWYRQDEGTVFAEAALAQPNSGGNQFVLRLSDNSFNNQIALNIQGGGFSSIATATGGVFDGNATSAGLLSANTAAKFVGAYAANNLGLSLNGETVAVDTSAIMPTALTRVDIGSDHIGANHIKAGTIRRLDFWPRRLPNSILQELTR